MINAELLIKKDGIYYDIFSRRIRLYCPFCKLIQKRTKTYHSLKSLSFHIANLHKNEDKDPFSLEQIQHLLKELALAVYWGVLP